MASWKVKFAHYGPGPVLGDICPSMWSPAEAQLGILFCPSVYSYFYFTWNTGHLHCHFEMVKSLTTRCAVRTSTELPFTLPFGHVFWFTGIYSLCSPIAHSPTNSLFSTRNEPSSLSQPRLCEQRGYLTPGISLLWQTLWARTPPHPALNFHYAENKGGSTSQGCDPGWYTLICLSILLFFFLFHCVTEA